MRIKAHKATYSLENKDKVERALNGFLNGASEKVGGVAADDGSYEPEALIAEYDRLGGKITRDGDKVKTGSFYDFKARKPHAKPKVALTYLVNGQQVDVPDGEAMPGIVKAARLLEQSKNSKKGGKKAAAAADDSENGAEEVDEEATDEEEADEEPAAPVKPAKAAKPGKKGSKKAAPAEEEAADESDEEDGEEEEE